MREDRLDCVEVVGADSIVVATGVAIVAATPGFDVLGVVCPPMVLVAEGVPMAPGDAPPRTFPTSLQKPSRPVTRLRLVGAAEETYSAHVNTAPSKSSGTHAVLL